MQQRFNAIHYLVHSAVAGLCYIMLTSDALLKDYVKDIPYVSDYPVLKLSIIPLIAILLRQSDRLARFIIGGVPVFSPLLRRVLSGREHIEGHWPLVVVNSKTQELVFYGFLTVDYRDGQLHVSGDDWSPDGTHALWFQSVQARFQNQLLQYWYEQGENRTKPTMRGYTEIYFFPLEGSIERHAGEFLDKEHNYRFYAQRKHYGWRERTPKTDAEKIASAEAVWQSIQPQLPRILNQSIAKDWI